MEHGQKDEGEQLDEEMEVDYLAGFNPTPEPELVGYHPPTEETANQIDDLVAQDPGQENDEQPGQDDEWKQLEKKIRSTSSK